MTWEEREEIFAKEILRKSDIMKLFDCSDNEATRITKMIKVQKGKNVREVQYGAVHIEDYFDVFGIKEQIRYTKIFETADVKVERKSVISENMPLAVEFWLNNDRVSRSEIEKIERLILGGRAKLVSYSLIGEVMKLTVA